MGLEAYIMVTVCLLPRVLLIGDRLDVLPEKDKF